MVRLCEPVFRNLTHLYTWSLKKHIKKHTIHILDRLKCWPIHIHAYKKKVNYCISQIKRHLSIILNTDTHLRILSCLIQLFIVYSSNLITWTNPFFEKWGLLYTNPEKSGQSYTFCWKKVGCIIYLAALKKGAKRHAHPCYAIYWKLPVTPPHPPPPTHTHTRFYPYPHIYEGWTEGYLSSTSLPLTLTSHPLTSIPRPIYAPSPLSPNPPPTPPPPHTHTSPVHPVMGTGNQLWQDCWLVQKCVGVVILCKATCDWLKIFY